MVISFTVIHTDKFRLRRHLLSFASLLLGFAIIYGYCDCQ